MSDIDLLLITDEPMAWEGDYWKRNHEKDKKKMLALSITGAERETVNTRFGLSDYLVPIPGEKDRYMVCFPHRPHLSVCDIATVAADAGYKVRVVDNVSRFPERTKVMNELLAENPKAVGLSTTFLLTPELVQKYVKRISDGAPKSKIILGGPTVRRCRETHSLGDYVVFGDGEDSIIPIMEAIDGDRSPADIPCTAVRGEDSQVHYTESAVKASRLGVDGKAYMARDTRIPIANWKLLDRSMKNVFPIEFSRGCRYNCAYCSYDRGKFVRDLGSIREELLINAGHGITRYRISDANFTDGPVNQPMFPNEVCNLMIDLGLGLQWSCYGRADNITDPLAKLLKRSGCFSLCFGIESGDEAILKKMNKRHNVEDAYRAIQICKDNGIFVHANFVVGFPGETKDSFEHTLEFIERSRPDTVAMGQFRLVRNSTIWGMREKYQLEGDGMVWKHVSMDNKEADELLFYGMNRLINNGIVMGHEFGFPLYLGLGLSVSEAYETMRDMHIIVKEAEYRSEEEFQAARQRLKEKFLNIFPKALAEEQAAWRSFNGK